VIFGVARACLLARGREPLADAHSPRAAPASSFAPAFAAGAFAAGAFAAGAFAAASLLHS
jgi:hypothetical protein